MGCYGCNKNSLKGSILLQTPEDPPRFSDNSRNEVSSEGNQFSETENPINNIEINEKDINIENRQKYNNENYKPYPIYDEEGGIIDSQIKVSKI